MAGQGVTNGDKDTLSWWRIAGAIFWVAGVLSLGVLTRLEPGFSPCNKTVVEGTPTSSTETTTNADGSVVIKKTKTPVPTETTTACEPLGAAELALLMLPVLIFIWPALKGFNIGGVGVDLREIERKAVAKAEETAQEQVIRVIVEREVGTKTEEALRQVSEGNLTDLSNA